MLRDMRQVILCAGDDYRRFRGIWQRVQGHFEPCRGFSAGADYLGLKTVRKNVISIVIQQIGGHHGDPLRGFQYRFLFPELSLDGFLLVFGLVREILIEQFVQRVAGYFGIDFPAFIDDLQGRAVRHRLFDGVGVDITAEGVAGLLFFHQRRPGKRDLRGIRQGDIQVHAHAGVMAAVGFIHQHHDFTGGIQLLHHFRFRGFLDFLQGRSDQVGRVFAQQLFQFADVPGMAHRFMLGAGQYAGKLLVQLHPVGDEDDFIILEFCIPAHLQYEEHHGQRLARTLGVPDHAAPVIAFLFRLQPPDGFMHCPVLLVTADFLDHLAVGGFKDGKVADDVQQILFAEYALQ